MAIPALTTDGVLPAGIFDCTLVELRQHFGGFQNSDRRPVLFARLDELYVDMRKSGMFESLVIDGSFVTAKSTPNDIDIIAVLARGHDFERDLPVSEYALVSRAILRRRTGFDVVIAERDSVMYNRYIEFFSLVRENPELRKGMLRVSL